MAQVACIIKANDPLGLGRQVFFCSRGGFDTHTLPISEQNNLLTQLDGALKASYDASVELGVDGKGTTFRLSEFGRTLKPAAGNGRDHGWGSHQIVMGGAVRGGDRYGRMPAFLLGGAAGAEDSSSGGRWIPSTSVEQLGATLARWFGALSGDLSGIFPNLSNFGAPDLGFML